MSLTDRQIELIRARYQSACEEMIDELQQGVDLPRFGYVMVDENLMAKGAPA